MKIILLEQTGSNPSIFLHKALVVERVVHTISGQELGFFDPMRGSMRREACTIFEMLQPMERERAMELAKEAGGLGDSDFCLVIWDGAASSDMEQISLKSYYLGSSA